MSDRLRTLGRRAFLASTLSGLVAGLLLPRPRRRRAAAAAPPAAAPTSIAEEPVPRPADRPLWIGHY